MRILALADLHSDYELLDRLAVLPLRKERYDLYLIAGDLTQHGGTDYVQRLLNTVSPVLAVPGNNDPDEVVHFLEMAGASVHKKTVHFDRLKITGFGFSPPTPFDTPGELPEDEIYRQASGLEIDEHTLLLAHAPPYGVLDKIGDTSVGSKALAGIVQEKQPFLYLCGHIHEQVGVEHLGATTVVNIPPAYEQKAAVISIDERIPKLKEVEFVQL